MASDYLSQCLSLKTIGIDDLQGVSDLSVRFIMAQRCSDPKIYFKRSCHTGMPTSDIKGQVLPPATLKS
jgi:hypothetical protein